RAEYSVGMPPRVVGMPSESSSAQSAQSADHPPFLSVPRRLCGSILPLCAASALQHARAEYSVGMPPGVVGMPPRSSSAQSAQSADHPPFLSVPRRLCASILPLPSTTALPLARAEYSVGMPPGVVGMPSESSSAQSAKSADHPPFLSVP